MAKKYWIAFFMAMLLWVPTTGSAAPVENEGSGYTGGIYQNDYSNLPSGDSAYYRIDFAEEASEEEDEGFLDGIRNFNPVGDGIRDQMNYALETSLNIIFTFNMMMTNIMINTVQFSMDTDIVNGWIEGLDGFVQSVTGVSNYGMSGGLFGSISGIAVLLVLLYAVYKIYVAKSAIAGLGAISQYVLAIMAAVFLFTNFVPILTGLNSVTTNLSATVMAGGVNLAGGQATTEDDLQEVVGETLWGSFVARPYLILQYNSDDINDLGESRINELLAMRPGEDRQEFVNEVEASERGNTAMQPQSTYDRISFTMVYSLLNIVVSIPIFGLALMLLLFQAWFLIIAGLSPFVLVVSLFPGQLGIVRRYLVELAFPLAMKFFVTAAMLFVFTLGFITYQMEPNGVMSEYYTAVLIQIPIYAALFFMQKRIRSIFGSGEKGPFAAIRGDLQGLRRSLDSAAGKMGTVAKVGLAAATGGAGTAAGVLVQRQLEKGDEPTQSDPATAGTQSTVTQSTQTNNTHTVNAAEPAAAPTEETETAQAEPVEREEATETPEPRVAPIQPVAMEPAAEYEPSDRVEEAPAHETEAASQPMATAEDPEPASAEIEPAEREEVVTETRTTHIQPVQGAAYSTEDEPVTETPSNEPETDSGERGANYSEPLASADEWEGFDVEDNQQAETDDIAKGAEPNENQAGR